MAVPFGERRVTLDEVAGVAFAGKDVAIDKAVLEKAEAAAKGGGDGKDMRSAPAEAKLALVPPAALPALAERDALDERASRCVLAARLLSLLHQRLQVRLDVARFLVELLNRGVTPLLPRSEEGAIAYLAAAVQGEGACRFCGKVQPLAEALRAAGLESAPPGLTAGERATFVHCLAVPVALAATAIHALGSLVDLADNVAGLSCEAFEAHTAPFAQTVFEASRPNKAMAEVAANLRQLLQDSKCAGGSGRDAMDAEAFRDIPQVHGPAREVVTGSVRAVNNELNAAEHGPFAEHASSAGPLNPLAVHLVLGNAAASARVLASASLARAELVLAHVRAGAKDELAMDGKVLHALGALVEKEARGVVARVVSAAAATAVRSGAPFSASEALASVFDAQRVLAIEAIVACQWLNTRHQVALEASREAIRKKEEATRRRLEELAKQGKQIKARAGDEAPRKPQGLTLGQGTERFRLRLFNGDADALVAARSEEELRGWFERFKRLCDPLDSDARESLEQLLTKTNKVTDPKIPKGTRDFMPDQMAIRTKAFEQISAIFRRHGAVGIDTPVFELKETLTNKYGEDSKLIYDLADQGGEMLSLRYDLTVPFARFLATHNIDRIKRYHIARVYRRDNPAMNRGRFREFYQCDYDIAGAYESMVPDAEVLRVLTEILSEIGVGEFAVKINHRKLLDGLMAVCGVPPEKFRPICSAIDKLDKEKWETVRAEMIAKGLDPAVADRLGPYVKPADLSGRLPNPLEVHALLSKDAALMANASAHEAMGELATLFRYLDCMQCLHFFAFDLSLARGLDYYTGVIYEAVLRNNKGVSLGSIAAGGRYDNLVGTFRAKQLPTVGVSVGIERIFAILEEKARERGPVRATETEVYVASIGNHMLEERMRLCAELWAAGIKAEFMYHANPKPDPQLQYVLQGGIPLVVWLGGNEIKRGVVGLKVIATEKQEEVPRGELVRRIRELLAQAPALAPKAEAPVAAAAAELPKA